MVSQPEEQGSNGVNQDHVDSVVSIDDNVSGAPQDTVDVGENADDNASDSISDPESDVRSDGESDDGYEYVGRRIRRMVGR